ncbi:MAG: hypothetical protein RMA76_24990 [Deltaproteobacteria bacterium]|jgi:hypothetical protein
MNGFETIDGWLTEITADIECAPAPSESGVVELTDDDIISTDKIPLEQFAPPSRLVRPGFIYASLAASLLGAMTTLLGA